MANSFSRSELILGHDAMQKLAAARVAVFGVGGVGGYVVEALARTGIGALDLIDNDTVCLTNLNRQIIATHDTIGKYKVDVFKERVHAINPDCKVATYKTFFLPETAGAFGFTSSESGADFCFTAFSVEYTTFTFLRARFLHSFRITFARGHTDVSYKSATLNAVGSVLLPAPIDEITGTPASAAARRRARFLSCRRSRDLLSPAK